MTTTKTTRKPYSNLGVKLSEAHHRKAKILAAARGVSMQQVIQELLDSVSAPVEIDLYLRQASLKGGK